MDRNEGDRNPQIDLADDDDPGLRLLDGIIDKIHNQKSMNTQNFEFLKNALKYLGFGEALNEKLEAALREGKPEFQLTEKRITGRDKVDYTLHFKKGKTDDIYFFNKYDAALNASSQKPVNHTFYIDKNKGVTAKEAYNLLAGRSVYKDMKNKAGELYQAWIKLDMDNKDDKGRHKFLIFNNNYGFDVRNSFFNLPVQSYKGSDTLVNKVIGSLERGNLHELPFQNGQRYQVAANPQLKTISVYDTNGKPVKIGAAGEIIETAQPLKQSYTENMVLSTEDHLGKKGIMIQEMENPETRKYIYASLAKNSTDPCILSYPVHLVSENGKVPVMLNYDTTTNSMSVTKRNDNNYVYYDSLVEAYNKSVNSRNELLGKSGINNNEDLALLYKLQDKYGDLHLYNFQERHFQQVTLDPENRVALNVKQVTELKTQVTGTNQTADVSLVGTAVWQEINKINGEKELGLGEMGSINTGGDRNSEIEQRKEVDGIETRWVLEDELDLEMDGGRSSGMKR